MSETRFTPGPWRIVSERDDELKVKGPQDEWVADCADGFWSDEADGWIMADESEANAHLIAAAPDLYDTLVDLRAALAELDAELHAKAIAVIDLALAKARGE